MSKDFFGVYHHHLGLFGYTLLDIRAREGREGEKERRRRKKKNTNKEHFHPRLTRTKVGIFGRK